MVCPGLGKNWCVLSSFCPLFPLLPARSTRKFIIFAIIQICWDSGICCALNRTLGPLEIVLVFQFQHLHVTLQMIWVERNCSSHKSDPQIDHGQTFKCHTYECCSLASICVDVCRYVVSSQQCVCESTPVHRDVYTYPGFAQYNNANLCVEPKKLKTIQCLRCCIVFIIVFFISDELQDVYRCLLIFNLYNGEAGCL